MTASRNVLWLVLLAAGCEPDVSPPDNEHALRIQAAIDDLRFSQVVDRVECDTEATVLSYRDKTVAIIEWSGERVASAHALVPNVLVDGELYEQMMWTTGANSPIDCQVDDAFVVCQQVQRIPRRDLRPGFGAFMLPRTCTN